MRETPVSIVIPCWNPDPQMLAEAVESVLHQTHTKVEVLLVNDGSTDPASLHALDQWRARGTTVIDQSNRGPASARNTGIEAAAGPYILLLDHDDEILPTYAAKAARILDEHEQVGIVYCFAERFGEQSGVWNIGEFAMGRMLFGNQIFITAMFRKEDWSASEGFDESMRHGFEDHDFWLKILALRSGVVRIPEVLFRYRCRGNSLTFQMSAEQKTAAYARIFRNNISLYEQHAEDYISVRVGVWENLMHWKSRYGRIEDALARMGAARNILRATAQSLRSHFNSHVLRLKRAAGSHAKPRNGS